MAGTKDGTDKAWGTRRRKEAPSAASAYMRRLEYSKKRMGRLLQEARSRNRITCQEIGVKMGVHGSQVSKIESGERVLTIQELYLHASIVGCGLEKLLPKDIKEMEKWGHEEYLLEKDRERERLKREMEQLDKMDEWDLEG